MSTDSLAQSGYTQETGRFQTIDDKHSPFTCQVHHLSSSERTKRSLQYLGSFWGACIASVFIPILHFVLVPGFFLGGIFAGYKVMKQSTLIFNLEGLCPQCQTAQHFKQLVAQEEMKEMCPNCKTNYRLQFEHSLKA